MKKSILINDSHKKLYTVQDIDDSQIFQLVAFLEKNYHQPNQNNLTDDYLITFAKCQLGINLEPTKLIAEINISKP